MPVNSEHRDYTRAAPQWVRCRDAFEGSDAVKGRGFSYLPLLEGQVITPQGTYGSSYDAYRTRALFYPAMSRTVAGLTGLIFGKPPTISEISPTWDADFKDVTLAGVSLAAYGLELAYQVLTTGRAGTLVDMPEGASAGARPYWVVYPAECIINWCVARINGKPTLTRVVLREEIEVDNLKDDFVPNYAIQYRVLTLNTAHQYVVSVWSESTEHKGTWTNAGDKMPLRRGQPLDYIPFTFTNPTGIGSDVQHPPLLDLVDVNLSHYRTSADQEHGAHFTALPTPYITGHSLQPGETLSIGSGQAWILAQGSTAGMVEFSGAGLRSLAEIKEEKRLLMATLGARMLETQKTTAEAAQTIALRHAGERSALAVLADAVSQSLTTSVRFHLFWRGVDEPIADNASIILNPEIMDNLTTEDVVKLVSAWQAGAISHKTLYSNLEYGEYTRPGVTFDDELADIDAEDVTEPTLDLVP